MKICPNCKKEYDDEFNFCTQCGTILEEEEANDITEFIPEASAVPEEKMAEQQQEERKKFCTKCGAPLNPEARYCTRCGQAAGDSDISVLQDRSSSHISQVEEDCLGEKKKHRIVGIACVAVAIVAAIAIGIGMSSMINGYKQPIKQLENFINKPNLKNMMSIFPDVLIDVAKDNGANTMGLEILTDSSVLNDYVEEYLVDSIEESFGEDYKFSIEINDKRGVDLNEVKADYEEILGEDATDILEISKAYDLDITMKIDSDKIDEEDSQEDGEIRVVKMKGHWTLDWTTFNF